mgnify:CR=1 FL=1
MLEKIKEITADSLGADVNTLTAETSFKEDLGADSLDLFEMVMAFEEAFEVEIPSLRVLMETQLEEAEWVQARLDQLNLIVEKRLTMVCHGQLYQRRMKKAFEKRVCP